MDKILVKMMETTFGRSFIAGVFIAMASAISFLAFHVVENTKVIQQLNDRLIETEQRHQAENNERWRADIKRSEDILERVQKATETIKKRRK